MLCCAVRFYPQVFPFSFSFEVFTAREEISTNILYKTVFASETLEILSAMQLSQENSLKYALPSRDVKTLGNLTYIRCTKQRCAIVLEV